MTLVFVATLLFFLLLILIVSIPNNRKSRKRVWHINRFWSRLGLLLAGMPIKRIGKWPLGKKKGIIVSNHATYLDALNLYVAIPTYFRPLGKIELKQYPLFGFIYQQVAVMVDRSSAHSRARSMRIMWRVLKHESSILIFPEGTFNETDQPLIPFFDGAFRLAVNTQTPIVPIVMPDVVNRWHYDAWWNMSPGKNRVVYLDPIYPKGTDLHAIKSLKQEVYDAMETALNLYLCEKNK
jgi:1-acyl-sn-glycerol-3-phosphate acyltransferase